MSTPAAPTPNPANRGWLSVDNLKFLIEKFSVPVILAFMTWYLPYQAKQDSDRAIEAAKASAEEANEIRLYGELLGRREDADTAVRRDVFNKLMDRYMNPSQSLQDVDSKLVMLELLALNFHDSVNLSPLFWQLDRQIALAAPRSIKQRRHLERIAKAVKDRQFALLAPEDSGRGQSVELAKVMNFFNPERQGCEGVNELTQKAQQPHVIPVSATYSDFDAKGNPTLHPRRFSITVECRDYERRRLYVIVESKPDHRWEFWVDLYDFPLANFAQVSPQERFALVLDAFDDGQQGFGRLRLVYFPATRSGAKDKPHVTQIMSLMGAKSRGSASSPSSAPSAPTR
jgi:hypothetical protein